MNALFFYQLTVAVNPEIHKAVSNFVFEHGAQGLEEKEGRIVAYFPSGIDDQALVNAVAAYLHSLRDLLDLEFDIKIDIEKEAQQDWNAEWKSRLKPLPVSERILIKPTWVDMPKNVPEVVIEIDPEMAFGSGEHATTRLTLQLVEKNMQPGLSVLDVGVGAGILSIGALKLGAASVVAFDIDPIAPPTAKRNAVKNNVADHCHLFTGGVDAIGRGRFDLIAANVNRSQIVLILPRLSELLHKGGCCLLAGILDIEEEMVREACLEAGLTVLDVRQEKEWLAFETRKG